MLSARLLAVALLIGLVAGKATGEAVPESDQQRCQKESEYMAKHRIAAHVFGCIGKFEGIGVSRNPKPATCRPDPRRKLRITGDATCRSKGGFFYRVRSWR